MYITVKELANKINNLERFIPEELHQEPEKETENDYTQWIADVYHCSDIWGQKMTYDEMHIMLTEHEKEKDPEDYSPAPHLFKECCEYWNSLCDMYPN